MPPRRLLSLHNGWRSRCHANSQTRAFNTRPRQCYLNRPVSRPQAPYLSQTPHTSRLSPVDRQLLRLLSTGSRKHVQYLAWRTVKWGAALWLSVYIANTSLYHYKSSRMEREYPTPEEWSWPARQGSRMAKRAMDVGTAGGKTDWVSVGNKFNIALRRLESGEVDGQDVIVQEAEDGGAIVIADVGTIGPDVSQKSWDWRQGYCDCVMGLAKASENTGDLIRDNVRDIVFPRYVMVGPSNPDPRPVTDKMPPAPREEDCEPVFPPPETYYMRILTGRGFTTRQKLDAAWSYANWLEFSGANSAAEEMYRWAIDIARQARPEYKDVVDLKTLVVKSPTTTSFIAPSSNLLQAVTLMGVHRARIGDTASAFAILLSVLRARQNAPLNTAPPPVKEKPTPAATDIEAAMRFFKSFFTPSPPRIEPPPGDDAYLRSIGVSECDAGQVMLYLGEIMFASSPQGQDGLLWTRKAVDIVENAIYAAQDIRRAVDSRDPALTKCKQCLIMGFNNWNDMLSIQAAQEKTQNSGWLSSGKGSTHIDATNADSKRLAQLHRLVERYQSELDLMIARKAAPYTIFG